MCTPHRPVLLDECINALAIKPNGVYIDGTFGRGGHSEKIAERLSAGRLICIDRDSDAIEYGCERMKRFSCVTFIKGDFCDMKSLVTEKADGILLDLGVSSPQLDVPQRGFSYMADGPLDMRMDRESVRTAYEIVNEFEAAQIKKLLFEYGEERYAPKIAAAIVRARESRPIETTLELVDIIRSAMPQAALREKQHPAKRTFQALRIAVNDELGAISGFLESAPSLLKTGGRLAVITFHSLEDRIVKRALKNAENPCICPPSLPVCGCGRKPTLRIITNKPIVPGEDELRENPRSRSAKLRVAERI